MKKRVVSAVLASALLVAAAGCGNNNNNSSSSGTTTTTTTAAPSNNSADTTTTTTKAEEKTDDAAAPAASGVSIATDTGKKLRIGCWNDEFQGFFEKYYLGTKELHEGQGDYYDKAPGLPEGVEIEWVTTPSEGGAYQTWLDTNLVKNASASADDKIDFFLAEADYITKYADSDYTLNISELGLTVPSTVYDYTVKAASDRNGNVKGGSFQCCPSTIIYRRSIAKDVLGTDDPAEVQSKLDSWDKFNSVAAQAKDKGYLMTGSFQETFRVFSNNATSPWVTDGQLTIPDAVNEWKDQAKMFLDNGYTLKSDVWGQEKTDQMYADGKVMCFFGPAWYFNFCMTNAMDPEKGCSGDWGICVGPQSHFWGGTWLLAATGTDNPGLVADIIKTFTENQDVLEQLIVVDGQVPNSTDLVAKYAADSTYGSDFLGGQNPLTLYNTMTSSIKWENHTAYDQICNEKFPEKMLDYFIGNCDEATALQNFYGLVNESYGNAVQTP